MKLLDKFLGALIDRAFGVYFKGIRADLAQIHERLDALEKRSSPSPFAMLGRPMSFELQPQQTQPAPSPYLMRQPCPICGLTNCYSTHVIC